MIKTHKFKLGKYNISFCDGINGCTDVPDKKGWKNAKKEMLLLGGNSFRALHCHLHEAMEAEWYPNELIHDKEGYPTTYNIARFLWRLGYRVAKKKGLTK